MNARIFKQQEIINKKRNKILSELQKNRNFKYQKLMNDLAFRTGQLRNIDKELNTGSFIKNDKFREMYLLINNLLNAME